MGLHFYVYHNQTRAWELIPIQSTITLNGEGKCITVQMLVMDKHHLKLFETDSLNYKGQNGLQRSATNHQSHTPSKLEDENEKGSH